MPFVESKFRQMPQRSSKLVITVIDKSDFVGKLTGVVKFNHLSMTSVKDMVNKVIERASPYGNQSIYRLIISSHGAPGNLSLGGGPSLTDGKFISSSNLSSYSTLLGRLRPFFRSDAIVLLEGCQVAKGASGMELLGKLSQIFGVPVIGGVKNQNDASDVLHTLISPLTYPLVHEIKNRYPGLWIEGDIVKCAPFEVGGYQCVEDASNFDIK
jgi:hypothetical protein